jgi:hypothetical protein
MKIELTPAQLDVLAFTLNTARASISALLSDIQLQLQNAAPPVDVRPADAPPPAPAADVGI